uniref:Transmembrane protein n=1 Tax=Steinernema glaseri TaxID=37863 RepID=A0A1I8AAF3_9BILA
MFFSLVHSVKNTVLLAIHIVLLGSMVFSSIALFCRGLVIELYSLLPVTLKVAIAVAMGGITVLHIQQFSRVYFSNTEVKHEFRVLLRWFPQKSFKESVEKNVKYLLLSTIYTLAYIIMPIVFTSAVFPEWLNFGKGMEIDPKVNMTNIESFRTQPVKLTAEWTIRVIFLLILAYRTNVFFDWGLKMQKYVYKNFFGYERKTNKNLSVGLDVSVWMLILMVAVTLYYWFLVALGRLVVHLLLTPAYFHIYRNDVFAHATIGLLALRLVSSTVPQLVEDAVLYISSFLTITGYIMFFPGIWNWIIRIEVMFASAAISIYIYLSTFRKIKHWFLMLAVCGGFAAVCAYITIPVWIIKFVYGYETIEQAIHSRLYIVFLCATLCALLILSCAVPLVRLLRHLKFEYGEVAERLLNYDQSRKRRTPFKEVLKTFLRKHRRWTVVSWLKSLCPKIGTNKNPVVELPMV